MMMTLVHFELSWDFIQQTCSTYCMLTRATEFQTDVLLSFTLPLWYKVRRAGWMQFSQSGLHLTSLQLRPYSGHVPFQGSCVIRPSAHFETAIHVASLIHHLMENKGAEGGAHLCMPERAHLANLQINKHINNSTEKLRVKCYIFPNLGVRADQALRIYFLQAVFKKKQTSNAISWYANQPTSSLLHSINPTHFTQAIWLNSALQPQA